jgi:hypothetical protein
MSGFEQADIRQGSYIQWDASDGKNKQGLVLKVTDSGFLVRENGKKETVTVLKEKASFARSGAISGKIMQNIREVGENTIVNGVALRLLYGKDFFGQQSVSFLCSDALYEILLKDSLAPFANILAAPVSTGAKTFFDSNDFLDLMRKLPFTFLGQCLFQKAMQKKKFFAHAFENIITQSIAIVGTNMVDRYVIADTGDYYYP